MRVLIPALTVAVVVAVAAGCGGSKKASTTTQSAGGGGGGAVSGNTITIVEKEFSLTPSTITITKPGTYTINGVNKGGTSHAIAIDGQGVDMTGATVDPGGTSTITVDLTKAGAYDIFCPVGNHKSLGMNGTLTLSAAGSASSGGSTGSDTSNGYG